MEIFNLMSDNAKRIMDIATDEAKAQKQNFVGTEHILLGLLDAESEVAFIFNELGIKYSDAKKYVDDIHKEKEPLFTTIISYSAKAKAALQRCLNKAKQNDTHIVRTEDIATEILSDKECKACQCITALGVDVELVRKTFIDLFSKVTPNVIPQEAAPKQEKPASILQKYTKNLCAMARAGEFDPVIGRDTEIERVLQILCRRNKNNPVLIGEPGVGKTVIAQGLAQRIAQGNVPDAMKNKDILSLEMGALVAGAKYRGEFEDRLYKLVDEVRKSSGAILFIDEIHTIVGAGGVEGSMDAANILKPALASGSMQVIGATTTREYKRSIEKDSALERRFQSVMINEPDIEQTIEILKGLRKTYEEHHGVVISDEAIRTAVTLSQRYISDRYMPDKAIDVIDEAASRVRLNAHIEPISLTELENELAEVTAAKRKAVEAQDFESAASLRDKERAIKAQMDAKQDEWLSLQKSKKLNVTAESIAGVVSFMTGIPVAKISEDEKQRLLKLEDVLHNRVVGQHEAVRAISTAIRRSRAGISDPRRPIGTFLFVGPTGVGKTELCKALADTLFGDEDALIRIDMSEYMELHSVSKLIGSPPGYVGYEEGGQLTERVRRKPYSVLLFDEVEKAHPDVFNIMLQLLDDGRLTDSQGRTVNFRNTVIVLTSNAGASLVKKQNTLGFASTNQKASDHEAMKSAIMDEVKRIFRPEFINRLDDIITFSKLSEDDMRQIVDIMLKATFERIAQKGINVVATDKARQMLAEKGYDPVYGARPLKRLIQKTVEDKLSECILSGNGTHAEYILDWAEDDFIVCENVTLPQHEIITAKQ